MRQSVERMDGSQELQDIVISSTLMLRICPEYEHRRFKFMKGLLNSHAMPMQQGAFNPKYHRLGPGGVCYNQAFDVASAHGLTYCEGVLVASSDGYPVTLAHAWCCTESGVVVDPTCHAMQSSPHIAYLGIPFKMAYAKRWYEEHGFHNLLDGHPTLGDSVGVYADDPKQWKEILRGY